MSEDGYLLCPECGLHYPPGTGLYCPEDGKPLVPMTPPKAQAAQAEQLAAQTARLQHKFMLAGIDYFTEGQRLFRLVYILLVIQILLSLACLCFLAVTASSGAGLLANFLRTIGIPVR